MALAIGAFGGGGREARKEAKEQVFQAQVRTLCIRILLVVVEGGLSLVEGNRHLCRHWSWEVLLVVFALLGVRRVMVRWVRVRLEVSLLHGALQSELLDHWYFCVH